MALKATAFSFRSSLGRLCPKRNQETWIVRCSSSSLPLFWVVSFLLVWDKFLSEAKSDPLTPQAPTPPTLQLLPKSTLHRRGNLLQLCGTSTPLVTVDNIVSLEPYIVSHHIWEGKGQKKHHRQQL